VTDGSTGGTARALLPGPAPVRAIPPRSRRTLPLSPDPATTSSRAGGTARPPDSSALQVGATAQHWNRPYELLGLAH
jgi:hypothetical protein